MRRLLFLIVLVSCSLVGCSWFESTGVSSEEDTLHIPEVESPIQDIYSESDTDVYGLASSLEEWYWGLMDYDIQEYLSKSSGVGDDTHYEIYLTEQPGQEYDDMLSLVMLYYNLRYCPESSSRNGLVIWSTDDELANLFGFIDMESLEGAVKSLYKDPLAMFRYFRGRTYGNQIATYDLRYFAPGFSMETPYFRYIGDSDVVYNNQGVCLSRNKKHALLLSSEFSAVPVLYNGCLYYILLGGNNTHCSVVGDIVFGTETVDGIPISIYCDWQSVLDAVGDRGYVTQNEFVMFNNVNYLVVREDFLLDVPAEEFDQLLQPLFYGVDWNALCASYGKLVRASDVNADVLWFEYFGFNISDLMLEVDELEDESLDP